MCALPNWNGRKTLTTEGTEDHREISDFVVWNRDGQFYRKSNSPRESGHRSVVSAAMRVHSVLGPGLLESAYRACLAHELRKRDLKILTEVGLPVIYDGEKIELGYRVDLVVGPCDC